MAHEERPVTPSEPAPRRGSLQDSLARLLKVEGNQTWMVLAVLAAFMVGALILWRQVHSFVAAQPEYQIDPNEIVLSQSPPWIHCDLRREVLDTAAFDQEMTILDDRLPARLEKALASHPWVERVVSIQRFHPARLMVELEYRRPACMVVLRRGGLYPVDHRGVLLPTKDFTPGEAQSYPRLADISSLPQGNVGESWGDPRVSGGAAVAAELLSDWQPLGLESIIPSAQPRSTRGEDYLFEIQTAAGLTIVWGESPDHSASDEPSSAEKRSRLQTAVRRWQALDPAERPARIDLRRLPAALRVAETASAPTDAPK